MDNKILGCQWLTPNGQISAAYRWNNADQFTGLKDYEGRDIYEGDIIGIRPSAFENRKIIGEVIWFPGHCRFALRGQNHYLDSLNDYEILGNI